MQSASKRSNFTGFSHFAFGLLLLITLIGTSPLSAAESPAKEATLEFNFRPIFTFRGTFAGATPEVRAERAHTRLSRLTPEQMTQPIEHITGVFDGVAGIGLRIGDILLFTVLASDLDPEDKITLKKAAEIAEKNLAEALSAEADQRRPMALLMALVFATIATLLAFSLLWLIRRAELLLVERLQRAIDREDASATMRWARHAWLLIQRIAQLVMGVLWLSVGYLWLTYVLSCFPLTHPLSEKLGGFLVDLFTNLGGGLINAVPGMITVLVVLFLTKTLNDVLANFFKSVLEGRTQVPGLHRETVSATRRIVSIMVWGFGLAVAYPYIPLSNSEAFKGLSVLFGLMLTLGSAGIVNQLMSGLVLVYARALTVGDFVDIGGTVGVVSEVGVLSTKIIDMRNEEVTIPNAVLIGNSIRNYSRLAGERGTLVSTKVTIGYDTPWRQVHAMLIAAAGLTPGLRNNPPPFVYQRGLSDFYVEYELFAYMDEPLNRVPTLSALHCNIQDQFNQYGVQIMSPHFMDQPHNNVVVPPANWYAAPARAPTDAGENADVAGPRSGA
ncbi:mechanosensitive ion channel domain-containing protein [Propionivibrio sp.]|uniref:mechanosensitive ion channel family protein n=1 Tax=Propionivibrio sp. TaxID=2212460 RepID=UPI003BF1EFC4